MVCPWWTDWNAWHPGLTTGSVWACTPGAGWYAAGGAAGEDVLTPTDLSHAPLDAADILLTA